MRAVPKIEVTESVHNLDGAVECKCAILFRLCRYVIKSHNDEELVQRTPLGVYIQETRRLEEMLDAYGAKHNSHWGPFRSVVAAGKFASDVLYKLLHLKYSAPFYRLLPVDGDFLAATDQAVAECVDILTTVSKALIDISSAMNLDVPADEFDEFCGESEFPVFLLPNDSETRNNPNAREAVVSIATSFLNQVDTSDIIGTFHAVGGLSVNECLPALFSERDLRRYENEFHNLQAVYDTNLAATGTEQNDEDLPYLRGHTTVVFHLLEIATAVSHYYERHVRSCRPEGWPLYFLPEERTRQLLFDYCLGYSVRYLEKARDLCRTLLQSYAEIGTVQVPVPVYRGFHVRPSSLVAKIVLHYGTKVTMSLDGDECDASSAMDIIRFNEKIYAIKRRNLAEDVARTADRVGGNDLVPIFLALLEEKKIVLYSGNLKLQDFPRVPGETMAEYANRGIARLLATGKIDIRSDIRVSLHGDIRVLEDIRTLARFGYGEDSFGSNVTLPSELSYLKR